MKPNETIDNSDNNAVFSQINQITKIIKNNSIDQFEDFLEKLKKKNQLYSEVIEFLFYIICIVQKNVLEIENKCIDARILLRLVECGLDNETILSHFKYDLFRSKITVPNLEIFNNSYTLYGNNEDCSFLHLLCASKMVNEANSKLLLEKLDYKTEQDYCLQQTPLHYAIGNKCIMPDTLSIILKDAIGLNIGDFTGRTPLQFACEQAKSAIILTLLDYRVDVNFINKLTGTTPLHVYCQRQNVFLVHSYYEDGNKKSIYCNRFKLDIEVLNKLLEKGANANVKDEFGQGSTPLHYICQAPKINWEAFKLLIEHGADILQKDKKEKIPLDYIPKAILEKWIKRNLYKKDNASRTLLHLACLNNKIHPNTLRFLINQGLDLNAVDKLGKTCLHYLCESRERYDKLAVCLQYKGKNAADVNVRDNDNLTPLQIAWLNKDDDSVIKLVEEGADTKITESTGIDLLHLACQEALSWNQMLHPALKEDLQFDDHIHNYSHMNLVKFLIKRNKEFGWDINPKNIAGVTPLHIVCRAFNEDLIFEYLNHNADFLIEDRYGVAPIDLLVNHFVEIMHSSFTACCSNGETYYFFTNHHSAELSLKLLELFNKRNINIENLVDSSHRSFLDCLCMYENDSAVILARQLLENFAVDVDKDNGNGKTTLEIAIERQNIKMAALLLSYTKKLDVQIASLLKSARKNNCEPMITLLLKAANQRNIKVNTDAMLSRKNSINFISQKFSNIFSNTTAMEKEHTHTLTKFNFWYITTLENLSKYGLTPEMLQDVTNTIKDYDVHHCSALRNLIEDRGFNVNQALAEITGLNCNQAYGIREGLTRVDVINLYRFCEIDALVELKKHGITTEMLQDCLSNTPAFDHDHRSALVKLIVKRGFKPQEALDEIRGLTTDQAYKIKNGQTREQVSREELGDDRPFKFNYRMN